MTRGRPPIPTALKLLNGTAKTHPELMNRGEPMPTGIVEPPDYLSQHARATWDQIAPAMISTRMLTSVDVPMFAEFCEAVVIARMARVRAAREATGRAPAQPGATSATGAWVRALGAVVSLAGRFGLTPADRARLDLGQSEHSSGDLLSAHTWGQ